VRVSDDSIIQDVTTEPCILRASVLHVGASQMRLSHKVITVSVNDDLSTDRD
jgi:hypothetical protein